MKRKRRLWAGTGLLLMFLLWTILIRCVDVQTVGPKAAKVGFAKWNVWFHSLTGVSMALYTATDWLGLVPVFVCACFGMTGLCQWIRRKKLFSVDPDILLLGIYYLLVFFCYLLFEMLPLNYRPVLIDGYLEASYPSSTTLLVLSVMPTLVFQAYRRGKNRTLKHLAAALTVLFSLFMVIGRLLSGVHWLTDIIGSVFLSSGLFLLYCAGVSYIGQKKDKTKL